MDKEQVLKMGLTVVDIWTSWRFFYAKMRRDGHIVVPKLMLDLLRSEKPTLAGYVMEVRLEQHNLANKG